jgi:hypothetical protein
MGRLRPRPARRDLLAAALALGAGAARRLAAAEAPPVHKHTQQEAEYRDTSADIRSCAMCTSFQPPAACRLVEGDIAATGLCKFFDMVD